MWGYYPPPCRTPYAETFLCAQGTVLGKSKQRAKFQHRISMHHAVMRICISRPTIICAQNGVFRGFEGEDVKILCSDPQNARPCVNTRLLMYRMSKSVHSYYRRRIGNRTQAFE